MTQRQICIFILGPSGLPLAKKIKSEVGGLILGPKTIAGCDITFEKATHAMSEAFASGKTTIGICASGILIRAVANHLQTKQEEPPVIAVSEDATSVVPLLGGHYGGNELASKIAATLNAHAAITTASDVMFGYALDAPKNASLANPQDHKSAAAARLRSEPVQLETTIHRATGGPQHLVYHPHVLAVGIGCERGTDPAEVRSLLQNTLRENNLAEASIAHFGSIDVKEDEPAITQFAGAQFFTAEQLRNQTGRITAPSQVVADEVGTPSVAEASALSLVGPNGKLIVPKVKSKRSTLAIAQAALPEDFSSHGGKPRGHIAVVGIGPGDASFLTPNVAYELWHASDWVGYTLYLDLVEARRNAQTRHDFPLGDEEARCRHAIALAKHGKRVALVCSGDAGIYAMAALVYELIDREPCRVGVEVHPGISAFQIASAKAGAMIGHDFCCISLSDLLTPWDVIEKRLHAAAQGDFVISFYNPRSLKRRDQIEKAFAILKPHRKPETPIVIATNLGRKDENIRIKRFDEFNPDEVDMLTLVMVGASQSKSFRRGDGKTYAYTPRGYAKKFT